MKTLTRATIALLLGLAAAGCGDGTVGVTGTVAYGGQPLPSGSITFEPDPDAGMTGAGAVVAVKDGRFVVAGEQKVMPGKYKVRIDPPMLGSGMDMKGIPAMFPPYQTTAEVKADGAPLAFDVPPVKK